MKRRARPRPTYHHGDLRAALLRQVGAIIRKKGVASVSLREVARREKVSHGAPAHHFKNKAGLITAFAGEGYERLAVAMESELERSAAVRGPDRVAATGRGYVRFALENPEHFSIMFRMEALDARDPAFLAAANRAYGTLTAAIDVCVTERRFSAKQAPLITAAAWSIAHGLASLWISGRLRLRMTPVDPQELADQVTRLFVDGVIPAPKANSGE